MYHGIILDLEFTDPSYPEQFTIFAKRPSEDNNWILYGIKIPDDQLQQAIADIQDHMKSDQPYYAHFYNNDELIVVFKDKTFTVAPHISTWHPIIEHGRKLNIPQEQLDFWPNRFQDEKHYFKPKDFVSK